MILIVAISDEISAIIKKYANQFNIEPSLVAAICMQESGFEPWRARYEPAWPFFTFVLHYSQLLGITSETELMFQKTSWGMMQIIGDVARELGYDGHLPKLSLPENGILWGTKKLSQLQKKYDDPKDVISSYNQGSPNKSVTGQYKNQDYVDNVLVYRSQYGYLDQ